VHGAGLILAPDPWASVGSVCWYKVTDVMKLRG